MTAAPAACRSHLRLLEELQSQGATPVPGDPNLLVVSPEGGLPSGGGAFLSTGAGSEDGHLNTFGPNFKRNSPPMAVVHAAVRTPPERSGGYATQKTGRCSPSINFGISGSSSSSAREIQPLRC